MGVVWNILGFALALFAVVRLVLRLNRFAAGGFASPRFFRVLIIFGIIVTAWVAMLGSMEFVANKGPDDLGAMWHVGYPLKDKYGKSEQSSYTIKSYAAEPNGSGTYDIHFKFNGHSGEILSHYNRPARTFDHDEIHDQP